MAFGKGLDNTASVSFSNYIGTAICNVVAVCPNKAELEALGFNPSEEPTYVGEVDREGNKVSQSRIEFVLRTVPEENNGIEAMFRLSYFLTKEYTKGSNSGKYQIIDQFGRTAWATEQEIREKLIPMYSNGPANITADYRPTMRGEEHLTNFFKVFLGIPNPAVYQNGTWVMKDNTDDSLARFDNLESFFKGDFKEVKEIVKLQPNNQVKVLVGIRTTDEGKQYQNVFSELVLRKSASNDNLKKALEERKASGAYSTTEFEIKELSLYLQNPSEAPKASTSVDPFANTTKSVDTMMPF